MNLMNKSMINESMNPTCSCQSSRCKTENEAQYIREEEWSFPLQDRI